MPEMYGSHEKAALIVLLLANRAVPNPELRNDYGIELRPSGRDKLNAAGLLVTRKENRRYVHQITDAGIAWCEEGLANIAPPARSGPLARAAFEVLRQLARHLHQHNIRLLDAVRAIPGLESLIRSAYHELSVKPQDWVRLAKLRPKLNGADRDEVDRTLLEMTKTGLVHLAPDSDRKTLTDVDHAAAIRVGNEDNHLVVIEES